MCRGNSGRINTVLRSYNVAPPKLEIGNFDAAIELLIEKVASNDIPRGQYGAVLIDEGHDFKKEWLQLVVDMVDPDTNSLLFLDNKLTDSLNRYEEIVEENKNIYRTFILLDKIDPIIGVWRYLHQYRGQLNDVRDFIKRLRDFFIYDRPLKIAQAYGGDDQLLSFVQTLRDRSEAAHYYRTGELRTDDMLSISPDVFKRIIEGHKMRFVPLKKKQLRARQ